MTPHERAVIEAAQKWYDSMIGAEPQYEVDKRLQETVGQLLIANAAPQPPTITIWRFEDAPQEYRALVPHRPDAAYVMAIPQGMSAPPLSTAGQWAEIRYTDDLTMLIFMPSD